MQTEHIALIAKTSLLSVVVHHTPRYYQGTQIEELDLALSTLGNEIITHNVIIASDFSLQSSVLTRRHPVSTKCVIGPTM